METYEEKELNKVLEDKAEFGLKIKITSDNKETKWLNIDKRFIEVLKLAWVRKITQKQFLNHTKEDEVFCLIESFLSRWIRFGAYDLMDENKALGYSEAEEEIYKSLPTDKQKKKVIRKMLKDVEKYSK